MGSVFKNPLKRTKGMPVSVTDKVTVIGLDGQSSKAVSFSATRDRVVKTAL